MRTQDKTATTGETRTSEQQNETAPIRDDKPKRRDEQASRQDGKTDDTTQRDAQDETPDETTSETHGNAHMGKGNEVEREAGNGKRIETSEQ